MLQSDEQEDKCKVAFGKPSQKELMMATTSVPEQVAIEILLNAWLSATKCERIQTAIGLPLLLLLQACWHKGVVSYLISDCISTV